MSSISITYNNQFGSGGIGDGELNYPSGSCVFDDEIFIVDKQNHRIQVFDLNGNYLRQFGSVGSGNDEFYFPEDISINEVDGNLLIVDSANHRIKIHQTDGTYVSEFGSEGTGTTNFSYPVGIYSDDTYIFIADKQNSRIVRYDPSTYTYVSNFGTYGTGNNNLNFPEDVAFLDGSLIVADSGNNVVKIFSLTGTFVSLVDDTFSYPVNVSIIDDSYLCVVDKTANEIKIYDNSYNSVGSYGSVGTGTSNFYFPISSAYYNNQQFIVDSGNNRVLILDLDLDADVPEYSSTIIKLTKQLYPTGRAWYMRTIGYLHKLHEALSYSESRALTMSDSLLDSILPDNNNFDETDAYNWESALGILTNTNLSLDDRKLAILRKMQYPGDIKARQHYLYLQGQLQTAGFDVYVHENRFDDGSGGYEPYSPEAVYGTFTYGSSYYGARNITAFSKIANYIDESKDEDFILGTLEDLKCSFYVGGETWPNSADVDSNRKDELRELILKLKPANTYGILFINFI